MKKRVALIFLIVVVISTVVWSGTGKKRFCSALRELNSDSTEVILERYYSRTVLQTATMANQEFAMWLDQLPTDFGRVRGTNSKCWIPHHRIKFSGTSDNNVEICFTCDEIWTESTGRRKIPEDWRQPLRAMFLAQGITDTAPHSEEHLDSMIEEAEQGGDGDAEEAF